MSDNPLSLKSENPNPEKPRPSRLRRFFLRHLPLSIAGGVLVLLIVFTALYLWSRSAQCQRLVRNWIITQAESATGGRVDIASFTWRPLHLEADAAGITIHGLESPNEAPYARIANLRVAISIIGFISPRIELRSLVVNRPALHLIVYPDGTTNQPQPPHKKPGKPVIQTLFNLRAGQVAINQAVLDYDNRAAAFDFQNRYAPLDLRADDVSLLMRYVPAAHHTPEHYHIEAGGSDLALLRGASPTKAQTAHGRLQAALDLTRTAAYLRFLRITSRVPRGSNPSLEITGSLQDFAHPRWQAKATGDVDMRLLEPVTGYPFAPQGLAHLNLTSTGSGAEFRADGTISVDDGAYIDPNVHATGIHLDAHIHADPKQLLINSIVARLRDGGQIQGTVALDHWLPPTTSSAVIEAIPPTGSPSRAPRNHAAVVHPPPVTIPVTGKVTAQLNGVPVDTILDIVSHPPFQRLGLDALVNGPATASWSNGDTNTLVVSATLNLSPFTRPGAAESPVTGNIDAAYSQRTGSVDLRAFNIQSPASRLQARGHIGAYPLHSPSAITVDLDSHDLGEFDTLFRSLGLHHGGKTGVAAIPVSLDGQAEFHGAWTGSLADPHIAGQLHATQLTFDMPPPQGAPPDHPRLLHLDSADVSGSYSAAQIAIHHALLTRGQTRLSVNGTLNAAPGSHAAFGADSNLQANVQADKIASDDLQPFLAKKLPFTGPLDAQLQVSGPLHSPGGSGWVQLDGGTIYGEPVNHARLQGSLAGRDMNLTSFVVSAPAGSVSGSGSYNLASGHFQIAANGPSIDVSRIGWVRRQGLDAAGTLSISLTGSGTPSDPRINAQIAVSSLALDGQKLGGIQLTAHTVNHALVYNGTTDLVGAQLTLHGQTALAGDYATSASLAFSRFNVAALLKMAHFEGLTADSSLAGTVTVNGPLAHPAQMRGEASLRQMAVTLAGVHLKSEGGLHATLAANRIHLDPLHITGEDTDLHAQGNLDLSGTRNLDLAAQGSINLKLAETLDPDLTADGTTTFQVEAHGPVSKPNLQGRIDFQNASLSLGDLPNGLSQLHGTLVFNQNRLEVKSLTAMSGGGLLSVGGYLAYQRGIFADLSVTGKGIRIRYPQGISSLADASLRLQGSQNNMELSGSVLITRFTVSPNLDVAALAAQAGSAVEKIAPPEAPSNHIRLNVRISSSPQLNFQNAYAKLAGDVDLRLRGTVASPSLLGRVSITEGAATIAGTRYELERGDITFTNPVRIEPNIDLTATARVSDYDITLDMHGTPARMTVNYRSDPPLPEADVISLLALGHTQNQERLYTAQQEQSLTNPTTDALLGGALNATVSSRIQKLFGAGSVKIDPHYLGALGNSTSRITVQESFGRNVTLTYATDVDTTGQQLLQAEIAINRHISLLVARDESGVFSMVIKTTRRYR